MCVSAAWLDISRLSCPPDCCPSPVCLLSPPVRRRGFSSLLHLSCAVTPAFIRRSAVILGNSLLSLLRIPALCKLLLFSTFFVFAGLVFLCQGCFAKFVVEVWWTQRNERRPALRNQMEASWCKKKPKPYLHGAKCTKQKGVEYKKKKAYWTFRSPDPGGLEVWIYI